MNLFQRGNFTLASGATSEWKLECDALTDEDWKTLAEMVRQLVGSFMAVKGVPRGGLALARALEPFAGISGPLLVVDDVLTTGGSIRRFMEENRPSPKATVIGAVIFARGQCPFPVKALFQMPACFWPEGGAV